MSESTYVVVADIEFLPGKTVYGVGITPIFKDWETAEKAREFLSRNYDEATVVPVQLGTQPLEAMLTSSPA